ncbi:hypothetical protein WJX84_001319 [Apatococcus fuscideae]|uniref:Fungal lipase-type domain-containing protein n=1 Tax=Apatococcus fuscideae TaxID=2026836 RepID=A0AAW1TA25_9CHLO
MASFLAKGPHWLASLFGTTPPPRSSYVGTGLANEHIQDESTTRKGTAQDAQHHESVDDEPARPGDFEEGLEALGPHPPEPECAPIDDEQHPSTKMQKSSGFSSSGRYDLFGDVIIRAEFISDKQTKAVIGITRGCAIVGFVILMVHVGIKFGEVEEFGFETGYPFTFNIAVGSICLAAELLCLAEFIRRWIETRIQGKRWSRRRKFIALMHFSELVAQTCNTTAFVVSNSFIVYGTCDWFTPFVYWCNFVQWTSWNMIFFLQLVVAHGSDPIVDDWFWRHFARFVITAKERSTRQIVMDGSWLIHIPKMILWIVFEALVIIVSVHFQQFRFEDHIASTNGQTDCHKFNYTCNVDGFSLGVTCAIFACWITYLVMWALSLYRAIKGLQRIPYNSFKMANLSCRMQVRTRATGNTMFLLTVCLLWFGNPNSCSSFIFTIPGFADLQIVETSLAVALAFFYMPKTPVLQESILQVWLQEFAWTEKDVERKRKARAAKLPDNPKLATEPMFCFELAIKLFYWSCLVYQYEEADDDEKIAERDDGETKEKGGGPDQSAKKDPFMPEQASIKTAMDLFGLEHVKIIREPADDTKVLVGWNDDTVVLAFRGTNSFVNAKTDAQVWRTKYPKGTGNWMPGSASRVHAGFLTSWQKNGLNKRLVSRLCEIVSRRKDCPSGVKVYITGHSLGGALATLAAFDLVRGCRALNSDAGPATEPICYTFGAPRLGNHAFAKMYNTTVPNTWHVINDQDIVARGGKLWFLYKRPGQRTIINAAGDLIVRPSYTEVTMQQTPFASRLQHHFLTAYRRSLISVLTGQFGNKKLHGGEKGVLRLLEECQLTDVLKAEGPEYEKLEGLAKGRVPIASHIIDIGTAGADQMRGVFQSGVQTLRGDQHEHEHEHPRLQEQATRNKHSSCGIPDPIAADTIPGSGGHKPDEAHTSSEWQRMHYNDAYEGHQQQEQQQQQQQQQQDQILEEATAPHDSGPSQMRGNAGNGSHHSSQTSSYPAAQPGSQSGSHPDVNQVDAGASSSSDSDGDEGPDEEYFLARLQRLNNKGRLKELGSVMPPEPAEHHHHVHWPSRHHHAHQQSDTMTDLVGQETRQRSPALHQHHGPILPQRCSPEGPSRGNEAPASCHSLSGHSLRDPESLQSQP